MFSLGPVRAVGKRRCIVAMCLQSRHLCKMKGVQRHEQSNGGGHSDRLGKDVSGRKISSSVSMLGQCGEIPGQKVSRVPILQRFWLLLNVKWKAGECCGLSQVLIAYFWLLCGERQWVILTAGRPTGGRGGIRPSRLKINTQRLHS